MEPALDWYIDHVVVPSGPELAPVGPIRTRDGTWLARRQTLMAEGDPLLARAVGHAVRHGFVLLRRQLPELGVPDAVVRRLIRRDTWSTPRRGIVAVLPRVQAADLAGVALSACRQGAVPSHTSAALLRGLPLLEPAGPPTVTSDHQYQACSFDNGRIHVAGLSPEDLEEWYGTTITSVERIIVDLARSQGVRQGLVAADAALHERVTSPRRLRRAVERQAGWPGSRAAQRVVELADARAESVLESLTRLCLVSGGLPTPELQAWVDTAFRRYRVDMLYRRERVVIEVDGLVKYRAAGALADEKRRQEYLERAGYRVVRVLWEDVINAPWTVIARVRAALAGR